MIGHQELLEKATEIARILGAEWAADPTVRNTATTYVQILNPDGRSIQITVDWKDDSRLHIMGGYLNPPNECIYPSYLITYQKTPELYLKASRTAKALAREIQNRFLPDYTSHFEACKASLLRLMANRRNFQTLLLVVAMEIGYTLNDEQAQNKDMHVTLRKVVADNWTSIEVNGGKIDLTVDGLSFAQFQKIVEVLKEGKDAD